MSIFGPPKQYAPLSSRQNYISSNPIAHQHGINSMVTNHINNNQAAVNGIYNQDGSYQGHQMASRRQDIPISRSNQRQSVFNNNGLSVAQNHSFIQPNGSGSQGESSFQNYSNVQYRQNNSHIQSQNNLKQYPQGLSSSTLDQSIIESRNQTNLNKSQIMPETNESQNLYNHIQISGIAQERGASLDPYLGQQSREQAKRHLPINVKDKVFNEWAAVLRHQDEINEQKKREEFEREKQRQLMYKNELDEQMAMKQYKVHQTKHEDRTIEQSLLDYQKRLDQEKNYTEQQKKDLLKKMVQDKVQSSLQEKERMKQEQRENQRSEQQRHREAILNAQEAERQYQMRLKAEKNQIANQYNQELQMQEQMKRHQQNHFKQADKMFSRMELEQAQKLEENRQYYFDNLKRYQELNDLKHQQLSNYLTNDINQLSKMDEAAYLKAVREKNEKDQRREEEEMRKQLRTKNMNKDSLLHQMQEKQMAQQMKAIEDKQFAQYVKNVVLTEQQKEQMRQEEAKQRQKEYLSSLQNQMQQQQVKKKYDTLMTEHERRVNDKDIEAYEYGDNSQLHSKVPGIGGNNHDLQDKYIQKMFVNQSSLASPQKSAMQYGNISQDQIKPNGSPYGSPMQVRGMSNQNNRSSLQFGAQNLLQLNNRSLDQSTIEEARRNMEVPDALRFRHNTGNRAYGFVQTLEKQVPRTVQNSRISYNYAVAGNYKA